MRTAETAATPGAAIDMRQQIRLRIDLELDERRWWTTGLPTFETPTRSIIDSTAEQLLRCVGSAARMYKADADIEVREANQPDMPTSSTHKAVSLELTVAVNKARWHAAAPWPASAVLAEDIRVYAIRMMATNKHFVMSGAAITTAVVTDR